jgi:hypothetical protein
MSRQRGLGFAGVLALLIGIVFVAILGMKLAPAYLEYFAIKKAVTGMIESGELRNATVADVRKAFDRRAVIDDITSIQGSDLEVTKEGSDIVVGFAYEKRIPIVNNVSVLIDFKGSSKKGSTKALE